MLKAKFKNGWSDERRKKQAMLIQQWKPWEKSTGAKTLVGKKIVSQNAYKGGYWKEERELRKLINVELKNQKALLEKL